MLLLFSHELTADQIEDAQHNLGITEFVKLPADLQKEWSNIAPTGSINSNPFEVWIYKNSQPNDMILVSGDFGMTFTIVEAIKSMGKKASMLYRECCYATTERQSVESKQPDGSIKKTAVFKHVQFRLYY